jgi:oligoribonuclease
MAATEEKAVRGTGYYVWFDTEYTGLELEKAQLLQVAALITDTELRRVLPRERDVILPIRISDGSAVSPWVEQNLPDLVGKCRSPMAADLAEADRRLAAYVDAVVGPPAEHEKQRPVLAGNSVHADWWLVHRFLPKFRGRLHYRHLDVTAFKLEWLRIAPETEFAKENPEMVRQYFHEAELPASESRHDAYYDLQASIAELAFYRRHLLRGLPSA